MVSRRQEKHRLGQNDSFDKYGNSSFSQSRTKPTSSFGGQRISLVLGQEKLPLGASDKIKLPERGVLTKVSNLIYGRGNLILIDLFKKKLAAIGGIKV